MRFYSLVLLFFGFTSVEAMDPPAISWVTEYGTAFHDVHETSNNQFIVAGRKYYEDYARTVFLYNESGILVWETGVQEVLVTYAHSHWVEELSDGSFIATGVARDSDAVDNELTLFRIDSSGEILWAKKYDFPYSHERGECVHPMDDGGFAVTGLSYAYPDPYQTLVLRTDAQGDTLWTFVCSEPFSNQGQRIFETDDGLLVFSSGTEYSGGSIRLLLFSDTDGSLLWEYDGFPGFLTSGHLGGDMTLSGTDNGYTIVTSYWPQIVHTDSFGNVLWNFEIPAWWQPYGHSINSTMDGGYIYGGENKPDPDDPESFQLAEVVKFDSEGNVQWANVLFSVHSIHAIRQLHSGGYIACGGESPGELVRYEPETGIESATPPAVAITSLSSNPFSGSLTIAFNLHEPSEAVLSIYDLSGRLVDVIHVGSLPSGEHSSIWAPESEPSGCYLIRLSTSDCSVAQRCVLVR